MIECVFIPREGLLPDECIELAEAIDLWKEEVFYGHGLIADPHAIHDLEEGELPSPYGRRLTEKPRDELLEFRLARGDLQVQQRVLGEEYWHTRAFLVEILIELYSPRQIADQLREYIPKSLVDRIFVNGKDRRSL